MRSILDRTQFAACLGSALLAVLGGCQVESPDSRAAGARAMETGYRGSAVLEDPGPRPDFTLTDTDGRPYSFRGATAGKVALLFFGYTYCPDVCPVHMASIAAVLRDFSYADRQRFEVVFVTVDPDRDSAERLRSWLDNFDPGFVGLSGDTATVNQLQRELFLPVAMKIAQPGSTAGEGVEDYTVGHASHVIAFAPDDGLRVLYPFGTRQSDWAHDLPKLAATAVTGPHTVAVVPRSGPAVENAVMAEPPTPDMAALYFVIRGGPEPDVLAAVEVEGAHTAEVHRTVIEDGLSRMEPAGQVEIPAGSEVAFRPGGLHVMVHGPGELAAGDEVPITLRFETAGPVETVARVVTYADLEPPD